MFKNSRVLVVGGAGFVGSNLVRRVLDSDPREVTIVDNLLSAEESNIPRHGSVQFCKGSIADDDILRTAVDDRFDYIFHLATYHGNQSSIHDPIADHQNNLITTLKLMQHVSGYKNLKKLVYSGAGCAAAKKTFDEAEATTEDAALTFDQDSPYSISKLVGEFYAVYFHRQNQVPTVRARFQNVYGPGEILGAGDWRGTPATVWRNVTPTFIYKSMNEASLPLHNEGAATRDFIYVDDITRGLAACAMKGTPGDVYNLATGDSPSIREWAETINEIVGNPTPLELLPGRPWDTSGKRYGSTEKSTKELGFTAEVKGRKGLETTIEWTKANLDRIEACMARHADKMADAQTGG
ncbi:MAG: NAD-dependent epimerase/dehydratase family protein [Myxococcota bacterium]